MPIALDGHADLHAHARPWAWHPAATAPLRSRLRCGRWRLSRARTTIETRDPNGKPAQVLIQLYGIAATLVWSGGVTYVLLKLVSAFVPLRVSLQQELEGLDISQHGEALQ